MTAHAPHFHPVGQEKIEQKLAEILQKAHELGIQFGQTMIERAVGSIGGGDGGDIGQRFLDRARAIVSGIVDRVRELIGNALSGDGEQTALDAVTNVIDQLPELVAETEIPSEVENAVMGVFQQNNVMLVEWIADPGACPVCVENAVASPLLLGASFPSGHTQPPAHPRCRCSIAPIDGEME